MIRTYSTTIRRKEMDAVLTCMVDEKIGPGEINARLIRELKVFLKSEGAAAFRSPAIALKYALSSIAEKTNACVMVSALAPSWHANVPESLGYKTLVLDVEDGSCLLSLEEIQKGITAGGTILLLHEPFGLLPDFDKLAELGIPIIEDISESVGSFISRSDENGKEILQKHAGSFGSFAILGLEEHDVITGGGGAVVVAFSRKNWQALKAHTEVAPLIDLLPDLNAALALVGVKEFRRNEEKRKELFSVFQKASMASRNKTFVKDVSNSTCANFPLVIETSFNDAKQYAARYDIEIEKAFSNSVIAEREETLSAECKHAKSLLLRTVLFPLYPRLKQSEAQLIAKTLQTMP